MWFNIDQRKYFGSIRNLKCLELSERCDEYMLYTVPSIVQTFKTSKSYFKSIDLKDKEVLFIYQLKNLIIDLED